MSPPYILDPANPYMNTLHGARTGEISDCARRTLRLTGIVSEAIYLAETYPEATDHEEEYYVPDGTDPQENSGGLFGRLCILL